MTADSRDVLKDSAVEAVFLFPARESHVPLTEAVMKAPDAVIEK